MSTLDFKTLGHNLLSSIETYVHTTQSIGGTNTTYPFAKTYEVDEYNGTRNLFVNGSLLDISKMELTAHQTLSLTKATNSLTKTLDAFQSAIKTIPGLLPGLNCPYLRFCLHPQKSQEYISLESASLCASNHSQNMSMEDQMNGLVNILQDAHQTSQNWIQQDLKTWYVTTFNDSNNTESLPREIKAPTVEDAFKADIWNNWSFPSNSTIKLHARLVDELCITHKNYELS
jgi:hypothetical protein